MNKWQTVELEEVISFNPSESIAKGKLAKKIAMEKLQPFYKFINTYEEVPFNGGAKFRNGDTLLARITPCLENGKTAQVTILDDNEVGYGSTEFIVMREKANISDKDFIYYYAISPDFRDIAIKSMVGSSGRQRVQQDVINNIVVSFPPLPEQVAIADTLSCLDNKIELNNRINKALEEIAQAIFKRWFVDFEFPNEDGQPYKSSGGAMMESELGEIPQGWVIKPLYEFANYINGTSFKKEEYASTGLPIIKIAELKNGITQSTQYFNGVKDSKFHIKDKDILFSWSGNPDTSIDIFIWHNGNAILNQHTFKIETNEYDYSFIYLLLKSFVPEFSRIASNKQTTGLGHVTVADLKRLEFSYNKQAVVDFCDLLNPIIDQYFINTIQNDKLTLIRNALLPKLMSGEVRAPAEGV